MPTDITPKIPQEITVHLGPADQPARNVTVPFVDYIKNVAASEIYPTWDNAAIRANVLAQISYALNRVYTEYYPARGYDFDITSTTATDQKYIEGRNTFENIDQIVDEIFDSYIRRSGFVEPLAAKFCNGTTSICEGLSQWGSQELAEQGYNSVDILRNYYGDDIELVMDAEIQDIEESYPGTPLRLGTRSRDVALLQQVLNRISQSYPAIPKVLPVNGNFGPMTEASVKKFQSIFNLTPDGVVGRSTWYKLALLYVAVTKLSELVSEGQTTYVINIPVLEEFKEGDYGREVSQLQYILQMLGEFIYEIPSVTIDGVYGPATRAAVEAAQRQIGLPVTGEVDSTTWNALYREFLAIESDLINRVGLFPISGAPAEAGGSDDAINYSQTTRMTQFPGYHLGLGQRDTQGGGAT